MKNARARRHSNRRNNPSSVLCLPPSRPPVTQPRHEPEVARAVPLPADDEPLVTSAPPQENLSRQQRRQRLRQQAKAARRAGSDRQDVAIDNRTIPPESPATVETVPPVACARPEDQPIDVAPAILPEQLAPLPRNRSLTGRPRGLMAVGQWLRRLVMVRRPVRAGALAGIGELQALSEQLANAQRTLDRLIANAR